MKKMNPYRLQYWLYAVLNKEFGRDVKLTRDSLHGRYSVNRHGFTVHGHNNTAKMVFDTMVRRLKESGYVHDPRESQSPERAQMVKHNVVGEQTETMYVNVTLSRSIIKSEKPFVSVWPAVYYSRTQPGSLA